MNRDTIYFYQDKYHVFWVKVHQITDKYVNCITSLNIEDIEGVKVDNIEDFMNKVIIGRYYGSYIMPYSKLDEPFTDHQRERMMFPDLFDSYRDEINGDWNGDEELFFNYKKWDCIYEEPLKYPRYRKNEDYKDFTRYKYIYRNIPISTFESHDLLIPYEKVVADYPELMTKRGSIIGTKSKRVFREYNLSILLDV